MATTIVVSDDEEEKQVSRPPILHTRLESQSTTFAQPGNGPSPRSTPSTGVRESQTQLQRIFSPLLKQSCMSTTEKQVPGPISATTSSVPFLSHPSPAASKGWPSSQCEASGKPSLTSVEVIDLTGEEFHGWPAVDSLMGGMIQKTRQSSQTSQVQSDTMTPSARASDSRSRINSHDIARKPSPAGQAKHPQVGLAHPTQSEQHSKAGCDKTDDLASRSDSPKLFDTLSKSSLSGRTVPWLSEDDAAVTHWRNLGLPPMRTIAPSRGSERVAPSTKRTFHNRMLGKAMPNAAVEFGASPKSARKEDGTGPPSQVPSRPRLKLNGPKRPSSPQRGRGSVSHIRGRSEKVRSPHTNKPATIISNAMRQLKHDKKLRKLPAEVERTQTTESDSDDASVRMLRSIDQAKAMYHEEPQSSGEQDILPSKQDGQEAIHTESKDVSMPQTLKTSYASGSPELGEHLPAAIDPVDTNVMSRSPSRTEKDVAAVAQQAKCLSAVDIFFRNPDTYQAFPLNKSLATETSSTEPAAVDELQHSAPGQDLLVRGSCASNERGAISPDVKVLKAIFKPLVEEMRVDQEYLTSGFLSCARKDVMEFQGPQLNHSLPDPFDAAPTMSTTQSQPFNPLRRVRMESRVVTARTKVPAIESQAIAFQSEAQRLPKYNSIVRLGSNLLAPNDQDLRYLPYFPSEEEKDAADAATHKQREELLQGFGNRIKFLPEERKCAEQAEFWREYVEYFLEEVGCTCADVMFYLLHDEDAEWKPECQLSEEALLQWQKRETGCVTCGTMFEGDDWDRLSETLSGHKPDEETLARAGLVCSVFISMAKFSIWHIVSTDADVRCLMDETEKKWATKQEAKVPKTESLCMLCHVFDCPTHGAYLEDDQHNGSSERSDADEGKTDQDPSSESSDEPETRHNIRQTVAIPERPKSGGQQHECGFFCVDPQTRSFDILCLQADGEVKGLYNVDVSKQLGDPGFADNETCSNSCFWDVSNRSEQTIANILPTAPNQRFRDWSQRDISIYKSMLAACRQLRRGPCIMAITLGSSCNEIFVEILLDIHVIPHPVSATEMNKEQESLAALTHGYKDKHYWFESSQTYDHHQRRPFVPCSHSGPCHKNSDCTCWTNKVACEWICGCNRACSRRFQGCRCIARGAKVCFKDSNCDCWVLNRECDPWLCGKCGVLEVLDPLHRHDDSILKGRCKNAMMQRNIPKRTLKGPSEVHGWGLFAGTDIRANEFIGEYKGEVISEEESNRRGLVYHYRGLEYLFRLNKEQEIDSSRAGNKMRFINNSERASTINVYPQPMLCNGVQRIGLFAKRNLVAGEEMFFRYGYPESVTQHFWEKEDLEAVRRLGSTDGLRTSKSERFKGKGVKVSAITWKEWAKQGVGERINRTLKKSGGGKERYARFLDDDPESSHSQPLSHPLPRLKKRKRPSSPVIDETTFFDLPEASFHKHEQGMPSNSSTPRADPSRPSFSGVETEIVDSDSDDEEYKEDELEPTDDDDDDDDDDDASSPFEVETDIFDDDINADGGISGSASRSVPQSKGYRQTAAARAAVLARRKSGQVREKKDVTARIAPGTGTGTGTGTGVIFGTPAPPALIAGDGAALMTARARRSKKSSRSKKGDPNPVVAGRPYHGKKRGRPLGAKKGVDFK